MARRQWRCFHCDTVFISVKCARAHFGADETKTPACQLKSYETHLVDRIRELEEQLDSYRADDSHMLRAIYAQEDDHRRALIRAEEDGYNKGVRDMREEAEKAIRFAPSLDENGYISEKAAILSKLSPQMCASDGDHK